MTPPAVGKRDRSCPDTNRRSSERRPNQTTQTERKRRRKRRRFHSHERRGGEGAPGRVGGWVEQLGSERQRHARGRIPRLRSAPVAVTTSSRGREGRGGEGVPCREEDDGGRGKARNILTCCWLTTGHGRLALPAPAVDAALPGAARPSDAGATSRAPGTDTEVGATGKEGRNGRDGAGRGGRHPCHACVCSGRGADWPRRVGDVPTRPSRPAGPAPRQGT